jgi:EpsI family protein
MERTAGRYYIVVVLLILSGALAIVLRYVRVSPDSPSDFSMIPMESGGWTAREFLLSDFTLDVLKATNTMTRLYTDAQNRNVSLFVGYFEDQKYGSQIHSPRHCLPGGGWGILDLEPIELIFGDHKFRVNRVVIGNKQQRQVVYYWFRTRSGELMSEYGLKFDLVRNSLMFMPTDAALIRLTTQVPGGEEASGDKTLKDFLSVFYGRIENSLPFGAS